MTELPTGTPVRLTGHHPHAGRIGVVTGEPRKPSMFLRDVMYPIRFEDGSECMACPDAVEMIEASAVGVQPPKERQ